MFNEFVERKILFPDGLRFALRKTNSAAQNFRRNVKPIHHSIRRQRVTLGTKATGKNILKSKTFEVKDPVLCDG